MTCCDAYICLDREISLDGHIFRCFNDNTTIVSRIKTRVVVLFHINIRGRCIVIQFHGVDADIRSPGYVVPVISYGTDSSVRCDGAGVQQP